MTRLISRLYASLIFVYLLKKTSSFFIDEPARNSSIGGPDTQWAYPYKYFGDNPYQNVSGDTLIHFGGLADSITVSEVMDTEEGILCYRYE